MALKQACSVKNTIKNTGIECNKMLAAAAMIFLVHPDWTCTETDLEDPVTFLNTAIHADGDDRIYPLFGNQAPIRIITNNKENDVTVTFDDGSTQLVRYGFLNRMFVTTAGGLCYASVLKALYDSGYKFVEVDINLKFLFAKTATSGVLRGVVCSNMFAPTPDMADFKNPYKNNFQLSYSPEDMVDNGVVYEPDSSVSGLLDLTGLIDAVVEDGDTTSTTSHLYVFVYTDCGRKNLGIKLKSVLNVISNFVVKDTTAGTTNTLTGVVINATTGEIALAGTFVAGHDYEVSLAAPSVLLGNDVDGYEGIKPALLSF